MRLFKILFFIFLLLNPVLAQAENAVAILAGGCFWSMQKNMDHAPGVTHVQVGYTGGTIENPTYQNYHDEGSDVVPHVEAVEVTYDAQKTTYADLLDYYFHHIDPTEARGQFCDFGPGYVPVIFTNDAAEEKIAQDVKAKIAQELGRDVVVAVKPATQFWPAEEYHQDYYLKNPERYDRYRIGCGRDFKLKAIWSK